MSARSVVPARSRKERRERQRKRKAVVQQAVARIPQALPDELRSLDLEIRAMKIEVEAEIADIRSDLEDPSSFDATPLSPEAEWEARAQAAERHRVNEVISIQKIRRWIKRRIAILEQESIRFEREREPEPPVESEPPVEPEPPVVTEAPAEAPSSCGRGRRQVEALFTVARWADQLRGAGAVPEAISEALGVLDELRPGWRSGLG